MHTWTLAFILSVMTFGCGVSNDASVRVSLFRAPELVATEVTVVAAGDCPSGESWKVSINGFPTKIDAGRYEAGRFGLPSCTPPTFSLSADDARAVQKTGVREVVIDDGSGPRRATTAKPRPCVEVTLLDQNIVVQQGRDTPVPYAPADAFPPSFFGFSNQPGGDGVVLVRSFEAGRGETQNPNAQVTGFEPMACDFSNCELFCDTTIRNIDEVRFTVSP